MCQQLYSLHTKTNKIYYMRKLKINKWILCFYFDYIMTGVGALCDTLTMENVASLKKIAQSCSKWFSGWPSKFVEKNLLIRMPKKLFCGSFRQHVYSANFFPLIPRFWDCEKVACLSSNALGKLATLRRGWNGSKGRSKGFLPNLIFACHVKPWSIKIRKIRIYS